MTCKDAFYTDIEFDKCVSRTNIKREGCYRKGSEGWETEEPNV